MEDERVDGWRMGGLMDRGWVSGWMEDGWVDGWRMGGLMDGGWVG